MATQRTREAPPPTSAVANGWFTKLLSVGTRLAVVYLLSACASSEEIVDHSFAFDALNDSPGVQVLDYRYGSSKLPGAANPYYLRKEGRSVQRTNTTGPMRRGDSLYVKWRTLNDNKVYEETVDLRRRLPRDITDSKVYFLIRSSQLYVYLVLPRPRPPNVLPNGPPKYHAQYVLTIYPDTANGRPQP